MTYDVVIVGGGIVGLATGMKILKSRPDLKLAILEKENQLAKHQTANNSGVIHSGLYYKPGSLKATNCINGYHELVNFCKEEKIPFEITGKVVVATREDQKPLLDTLLTRGLQNGLSGTRKITLEELKEYEPHCTGVAAIHVPQTGIVDYYQVAIAYGRKIVQSGGSIFLEHKVLKINQQDGFNHIETSKASFKSKLVINCAGLYSDKVARMNDASVDDVKIIPFRGEYFKLKKEKEYLVKNLIYPVPDPNFPFLGVHFTRMKKEESRQAPMRFWHSKEKVIRNPRSTWLSCLNLWLGLDSKKLPESIGRPDLGNFIAHFPKLLLPKRFKNSSPKSRNQTWWMAVPGFVHRPVIAREDCWMTLLFVNRSSPSMS